MVMGFGLSRLDSDLSIHSFIVPFIIRSVEFLSSSRQPDREYYISGQPVTIELPGHLDASAVNLSGYDSQLGSVNNVNETIAVSRGAYGSFINLPRAGYPGFYMLRAGADTAGFFSVNPDTLESVLQYVDIHKLKEIFGDDLTYINGQGPLKNKIMQAKFGFELWKYCLLLALFLLIVESLLVKRTY